MENFIIWGAVANGGELSVLATQVNIQRIERGTPEFVRALLDELEISDPVEEWRVLPPFLTFYLTNDPDSEDWRDSWSETWDIRMRLPKAPSALPAADDLRRTSNYDDTWKEGETKFPIPLVMFAEFEDSTIRDAAQRQIEAALGGTGGGASDEAATLTTALGELSPDQRSGMSVTRRGEMLQVSLGAVGEDFLESNTLVEAMNFFVASLGGTVTWDDRYA